MPGWCRAEVLLSLIVNGCVKGYLRPTAVDVGATTVACALSRVAALCTIRWMTHGCPDSAPVCHMNVIGSPLGVIRDDIVPCGCGPG
jgi:hypothetical protein